MEVGEGVGMGMGLVLQYVFNRDYKTAIVCLGRLKLLLVHFYILYKHKGSIWIIEGAG